MDDHPSEDDLATFALEGTAVGVALATHLEGCVLCRAVVAAKCKTEPRAPRGPTLVAGTLVGRYRIEACLGQGGMGVVYRARDTDLDRLVALKLVRPQAKAEELTERLLRESRLQARAAHRSVITVYDIGRDGDQVYVAMELIEGTTLGDWLAGSPRPWRKILDVFREAAGGLAAAHAAGLVHRDFKPDNVLVELRDGEVTRVLVTDFGVARAFEVADAPSATGLGADVGLTATGAVMGTPAYMSPEQFAARPTDARSDVFSFCVALWEALYDRSPFPGKSIPEIVAALDTEPRPPARTRVPIWIVGELRRGLAIDPEKRTPSIAMLVAALDWRRRSRTRRAIASLSMLAICGSIAAGWLATRSTSDSSTCDVTSTVESELARVSTSPLLLEQWRIHTSDYVRHWKRMRSEACASRLEDQARCLDRLGSEVVAVLDAASELEEPRRQDVLRGAMLDAPRECMSSAAGWLLAQHPDDPRVRQARLALAEADGAALRDEVTAQRRLGGARMLAQASGFEPLVHEVAVIEAELNPTNETMVLRTVAQAADRASHWQVAARASLGALEGIEGDRDLLASADTALVRAGNPPRARALWHVRRALVLVLSDAAAARAALARAAAELASIDAPAGPGLDATIGAVYFRLADFARAESLFARVLAVAPAGDWLLRVRNDHARSLERLDRFDEARKELEPMLAGIDPGKRLPRPELARTIRNLADGLSFSNPPQALELLERWWPALDMSLERDALDRGNLETVRANVFAAAGRTADAERSSRRALEINVLHLGAKNPVVAESHILLGQILIELHRHAEAEEQLDRGIADLAAATGEDHARLAQARMILASLLVSSGDFAKALPIAERALQTYEKSNLFPPTERGLLRWTLAQAVAASDPSRARNLITAALADWGSDPVTFKAEIAAARAKLRILGHRR